MCSIKVKQYGLCNTINYIKSYLNYSQRQSTASVTGVPERKECAVNKDTVNFNTLPTHRACCVGSTWECWGEQQAERQEAEGSPSERNTCRVHHVLWRGEGGGGSESLLHDALAL